MNYGDLVRRYVPPVHLGDSGGGERTIRIESIEPSLLPEPVPVSAEEAEELKRRWEQAWAEGSRAAIVYRDDPPPLLPGWTWPMADPEDPSPIYEDLIKTLPDPSKPDPVAENEPEDEDEQR